MENNILVIALFTFVFDLLIISIFRLIFDIVIYKIKQRKAIKKLAEEILKPQAEVKEQGEEEQCEK